MSVIPKFYVLDDSGSKTGWTVRIDIGDANYFMGPGQIDHFVRTGKFPDEFAELAGFAVPPPDFAVANFWAAQEASQGITQRVMGELFQKLLENLTESQRTHLLPHTKQALASYQLQNAGLPAITASVN